MEQREIDYFGRMIAEGAARAVGAAQQRDETNKPPMPAHDYAEQWARDTLSGKEGGRFEWGERNLARAYLAQTAALKLARDTLSGYAAELLRSYTMPSPYDGKPLRETMDEDEAEHVAEIEVVLAAVEAAIKSAEPTQ